MQGSPHSEERNGNSQPINVIGNNGNIGSITGNIGSSSGTHDFTFVPDHRTENSRDSIPSIDSFGSSNSNGTDHHSISVPNKRTKKRSAKAKSEKSVPSSLQYGRRAQKREDERRDDLVKAARELQLLAAGMTGTGYIRRAEREGYAKIALNARTCIQDCLKHHSPSRKPPQFVSRWKRGR